MQDVYGTCAEVGLGMSCLNCMLLRNIVPLTTFMCVYTRLAHAKDSKLLKERSHSPHHLIYMLVYGVSATILLALLINANEKVSDHCSNVS